MAHATELLPRMVHELVFAEGTLTDRLVAALRKLDQQALGDSTSAQLSDDLLEALQTLHDEFTATPPPGSPGDGSIDKNVRALGDAEIGDVANKILGLFQKQIEHLA